MCVIIKNNIKSVVVILFLVLILIRNWVFWVHMPSITDKISGRNVCYTILFSQFNNTLESSKPLKYSKLMLMDVQEMQHYLCNKDFFMNVCCNFGTNKSHENSLNFEDNQCLYTISKYILSSDLKILYVFENEGINKFSKISCEVMNDRNISKVDSDYIPTVLSISIHCFKKELSASTDNIFCDVSCGKHNKSYNNMRRTFDYVIVMFAAMLHIITLLVFLIVPQLQAGSGKVIISFVFAQLIKKCSVIITMLYRNDIHEFQKLTIFGK